MPRKKQSDSAEKSISDLEKELAKKKAMLKELEEADEALAAAGVDTEDDEAKLPGQERILGIISELKGSGTFHVTRMESGIAVKLGTFDVDLWPDAMESLVRQKGGGEYILIFKDPDGKYAGRVSRTYDSNSYPSAAAPAPAAPAGASPDVMRMFELMDRRDAAHRAEMESLRLAADKSRDEMMKLMMETMKSGNKSMVNSMTDVAAIAKMFRDEKDPIERMLELKELMAEFRGEAVQADASPLDRILTSLASALSPRPISAPRAPRAAAPLAPAPVHVPAPQLTEPQPVPPETVPVKASLAGYVEQFKGAIGSGMSPVDAAGHLYASVQQKPGDVAAVRALLVHGDWASLELDPFLKEHSAWVTDFRARLDALVNAAPAGVIPPVSVPDDEEDEG